jgi:phosphatidylinositol glycan class B
LGQQGPGTKPVAIRTQVPLGSVPPVRSPFATLPMHMIASKRPSVLERVRGVLADRDLLILLGLALAVRLAAIVVFPSLHHPDENFQLLEQAHRIAFGYGVVPWEFRDGIRSPVLPYVLAALFRLSEPVVGGPEGYLLVARAALAALSLIGVAAVYRMGRRTSQTHAVMAAVVAATWFELVYFAGRPLTEAVATTFLVVALSLASAPPKHLGFRRLAAIGFCLGLALMLRVHLAPGLLVVAVWLGRADLRGRWLPMALGGVVPLLVFGAADWLYWGAPFSSYVAALRIDLIDGKASVYGVEPPAYFFEQLADLWAGALPVMAALIVLRTRASALWIAAALAIIATHMLIPHKEYRFVFPAFACLALVAAMGSADLIERLRRLPGLGLSGPALVAIGAALWVGTSAALAFAPGFKDEWLEAGDVIAASFKLAHQDDLCGVLFYNHDWATTGGYAYLHRNVPIYALQDDQETAQRSTDAFNAIVLTHEFIDDFSPQYTVQDCSGEEDDDACIMKREGGCTPAPDLEVNAMLRRTGQ